MNNSTKMIVVLTTMGLVSGGLLAGFYHLVHPKIEENRIEEEKRAIFAVLEGIKTYDVIEKEMPAKKGMETVRIFRGLDEDGNALGYAFVASGPGFQGIIKMMVGLKLDLKTLSAMKVLEHVETPGLGNKITEDKFTVQFKGLSIEPRIEYLKNKKPEKPNQIQAVSGATISSRAIVETINKRVKTILEILAGEAEAGDE